MMLNSSRGKRYRTRGQKRVKRGKGKGKRGREEGRDKGRRYEEFYSLETPGGKIKDERNGQIARFH